MLIKDFTFSDKKAELIRVGYDTLEFSSEIDIDEDLYYHLSEVKKSATDTDLKFQLVDNIHLFMSPKSFGFYKFTVYDLERLFQISFNSSRCSIKVLATAFYTYEFSEIELKLNALMFQLFNFYDLSVSRIDLAMDIKFNYKFLDCLSKDDFYSSYSLDFAQYHSCDRCTGFTFMGNNLSLRVYDKLEESSKSEKKALFYKLFGIKDDMEYLMYTVDEEKQFVRIEYQLRKEMFKPYGVTVSSLNDLNFIKSIVSYFAENHSRLEGFNNGYLKMFLYFLGVDSNYSRLENVKQLEYEQRMYHLEKQLIAYITSYQVLREEMCGKFLYLSDVLDYIGKRIKGKKQYKESLEKKRKQSGLKMYEVVREYLSVHYKNKDKIKENGRDEK